MDPVEVMGALDGFADELDTLSKSLADTERKLEPVEGEYEAWMAAYEEGLWEQHLEGAKFPPEKLRQRMGHKAMPADLFGRYTQLLNSRKRMEKRIGSLKASVSAKQSILSALKAEAQATGSGLRSVG